MTDHTVGIARADYRVESLGVRGRRFYHLADVQTYGWFCRWSRLLLARSRGTAPSPGRPRRTDSVVVPPSRRPLGARATRTNTYVVDSSTGTAPERRPATHARGRDVLRRAPPAARPPPAGRGRIGAPLPRSVEAECNGNYTYKSLTVNSVLIPAPPGVEVCQLLYERVWI